MQTILKIGAQSDVISSLLDTFDIRDAAVLGAKLAYIG
jgi:hypothetical protein